MDTTNLRITYFTDTMTFNKRIIIGGADPSHTKDFKTLGGEFQYYLNECQKGWVFSITMEPVLEKYIKTGKLCNTKPINQNVLYMTKDGERKDSGICHICKKGLYIDEAIKTYIRHFVGGLPKKVTDKLLDNDYRSKISVAFSNGNFTCVECMSDEM